MPAISNQVLEAQKNQIRHLMHEEFKSDTEILKQLNIHWTTLYDYKNRIQQEDSKIWDLVHQDSSKFRAVQLLADLDRCRQESLKIGTNYNYSPKDRLEALKTSCEASANIFKLLNEGLTFNVSIPSDKLKTYHVETKEDKPAEDKDIVPVPEEPTTTKKEDKELIPSGHECWGLSTTRGYNHNGRDPPKHKKTKKHKAKVEIEDNSLPLADLE